MLNRIISLFVNKKRIVLFLAPVLIGVGAVAFDMDPETFKSALCGANVEGAVDAK